MNTIYGQYLQSLGAGKLRNSGESFGGRNAGAVLRKNLSHFLRFAAVLILMVVGVNGVKAQAVDYSGKYYIGTVKTTDGFYLCPTENWYYYQSSDPYYTNTADTDPDKVMPFLTTYKCKTTSGYDASKALWLIEKKTGTDYYYIIHVSSGKYLTYNDAYFSNDGRARVHLDKSPAEDDYALFKIEYQSSTSSYDIISKYAEDNKTYLSDGKARKYLNVNKGNKQSLQGTDADKTTPAYTGGIIGLWTAGSTEGQGTGRFFLEDYITRPTIGYDASGNIKITNNVASATVYYSIGENSDPKTSDTSFTDTEKTLTSFTDGAIIKAVAKVGDEYSNVVTFTAVVHVGSSNQYLIQNLECTDFYMVPGDVTNSNTTVNTTSLPQAGMSWHFEDAGSSEGVQYYYIINGSTEQYLYHASNGTVSMKAFSSNDDGYRFSIVQGYDANSNPDGFHFVPKEKISDNTYCIYKGGWDRETKPLANASADAVKGSTKAREAEMKHTRWNLILVANKSFPSPITISDNTSAAYYTFASLEAPAQLITPPTGTATYVKTSAGESDNQKWYFKAAGDDGWATYYYILNAVTGEAMYFGKEAASTTISDALEVGVLPETPTDKYKFALAKTTEDGKYFIIPKPLAQFTKTNYSGVWYVNTTLQTQSNRANNKIKWQITEVENYLAPPYITYDVASNTASISCTYPGATIYYTTDGTDPAGSSTRTALSPVDPSPTASTSFVLAAGVNKLRAIVSKDGVGTSTESTYDIVVQVTKSAADADQRPYLIQSKQCQSYNLIPNVSVDENTKYLSTMNVPCETMAWRFEYAEEGYYFVVDKNGWYLYYTATDNSNKYVYLKSTKDDSDGFKFSITAHANGGFNLIPKGQTTPMNKANYGGSNVGLTPAKLAGNTGDANSRWSIIPYNADNLTQWVTAPFDNVSDNEHTYYYKIVSVSQTSMPIILNDNGEIKSQTIPDGIDVRKTMWVIKKVADDGDNLLDFYTFQNAYTGEKLYYNGNGRNKSTNSFQLGEPSVDGANDQWSHFIVVQTENGYNIIPRPIVDNTKAIKTSSDNEGFNCINRANGSDVLGTYYDDGSSSRWTFSQVTDPVQCMDPVITLDNDNARFSMSCPTNAAKIYYTLDGTTPEIPASGTTQEYTAGDYVSLTPSVVKIIAVAAIAADGSDKSSEVTKDKVAIPTITINADNSVTITCSTDDATIYYKLGGDDPTTTSGTQSSSIACILPSQGPIKVFAVKDGLINSNIATDSNIPAKTITVSSTNGTLTGTDPIVYNGTAQEPAFTIKDGETTIGSGEYTAVYSDNTNAGTATVTITDKADGDYNVSGAFTFTIAQKALTVNANPKTITYGDAPANDGVTYDGFVNGESATTEGVFSGALDYDYSYAQYGDVGNTYTITPKGLTATNYDISFYPGTLTVVQKEVGLEWSSISLPYSGTAQAPTATATNLVNNDDISVTVEGAKTDVGEYTATASDITGDKAGNYKLPSANTTTFEITKKSIGDGTVPAEGFDIIINNNTVTITGLIEGTDFTATVDGEGVWTVEGQGNYTGSAQVIALNLDFYETGETPSEGVQDVKDVAPYQAPKNIAITGKSIYILTGVDMTENAVTLQKIDYAPEDVAVLLLDDLNDTPDSEGAINNSITVSEFTPTTPADVTANLLKKVTENGGKTVDFGEVYMFLKGKFVLTSNGTLPEGSFYFEKPNTSGGSTGGGARLRIVVNNTTGIDNAQFTMHNSQLDESWYTTDGRRLNGKPTKKGLYIKRSADGRSGNVTVIK